MLRSMVEGFAEVFLRDQWPSTPACKSLIMVRPERFELPTLWFEARCSIQLSYGRGKTRETHRQTSENYDPWQLRRGNQLRRRRRYEHRHLLHDVQPRTPQKLMDHRLGQPAGVILHPHGLLRLLHFQSSNSVYLAHLCHCQRSGLARRNTITVKNIKLGHTFDDTSVYNRAR